MWHPLVRGPTRTLIDVPGAGWPILDVPSSGPMTAAAVTVVPRGNCCWSPDRRRADLGR